MALISNLINTLKIIIMKTSFLILLLSSMYCAGNAQTKVRSATARSTNTSRFSIGLEAGIPVGENGKVYSSILGGSLQYETMPDTDLGITVSAGYDISIIVLNLVMAVAV